MGLKVEREIQGLTILLKLKGVLDISTSSVIDPFLDDMNDIESLIFDFEGLEFIDSTGIGSIINAIYLAKEKGFKLFFQGVDELTEQVFETVGLYQILMTIQEEVL
ncbi:STAS domain-containing protein [Robertmurraya massiliosenegalensis]|uniref:STAS domain-containing protein n=1 Tax=Robertmurraya TaxID=2837507 RepID=UPI0039A501E7